MKHLKKSFSLLMLLTVIIGSPSLAQALFSFAAKLKAEPTKEVLLENERANTGYEKAKSSCNPVTLNGKASDYVGLNIIGSRTLAQDLYNFDAELKAERVKEAQRKQARAKAVLQGDESALIGYEDGQFYDDRLLLNGKPLDYSEINLRTTGELTVTKGAAISEQIQFVVYLQRNGNKVLISGKERPDPKQIKVDISEILEHAEPGDHLVIEAVNKEDGAVKRILKLLGRGC